MRALDASTLLEIWERGREEPSLQRTLLLLAAGDPELDEPRLSSLPLGEQNDRLLKLRGRTFGPAMPSVVRCPECAQDLEFQLRTDALRTPADFQSRSEAPATLAVSWNGDLRVEFRLPNTGDLVAVAASEEGRDARTLLGRCLVEAVRAGERVEVDELPEEVIVAVSEAMLEADPQAEVRIAIVCPDCAAEWESSLDVAAFFWREIEAWAPRALREVHVLASAYGWSQEEILSMSAVRRRMYLGLLGR